ncbi:hypothetical protein PpBr36_02858, partial [Pyricularia pennisetigena]|uniref:hypothetical protein n=1 Tax=Pyricularia pennisetigena TaxID=1578925 RepID=UPI001153FFF1
LEDASKRTKHLDFATIPPAPGAKNRLAHKVSGHHFQNCRVHHNKPALPWTCRSSAAVVWTRRNKNWNARG